MIDRMPAGSADIGDPDEEVGPDVDDATAVDDGTAVEGTAAVEEAAAVDEAALAAAALDDPPLDTTAGAVVEPGGAARVPVVGALPDPEVHAAHRAATTTATVGSRAGRPGRRPITAVSLRSERLLECDGNVTYVLR